MRSLVSVCAALLAVALWATNATVAAEALRSVTALQLLTLQYGAAAATLAIVGAWGALRSREAARETWTRGPNSPGWRGLTVGMVGLTGTIFLQKVSFAFAPVFDANAISYGWPLLIAVWGAWSRGITRGWPQLLLSALGMAGVVLLLGAGAEGLSPGSLVGYVLAAGSAACMAFYTVAAGRSRLRTVRVLFPAAIAGTVVAWIGSGISGAAWPPVSEWPGSIYLGIGPMAAGYLLWTAASARGHPSVIAAIGYLTPFASTALLIVAGAPVTALTVVGAILILACNIGVLLLSRNPEAERNHAGDETIPNTSTPELLRNAGH
ncbi:DMT family transporter [Amycolatopsis umgeniensis]|uniref:Drug/metabolite transporter (DMT)-like permease n=1 Tax=Amycolatopsis umgeniensis TaxID=336628 RepID=A0A841B6G9_9PSEU|nr:DMT family transporter [Amycolatopsis umgeniensis]MBB5855676.1 drug/metabolite transporter (DMT)-like permease [Amycolatopsis umgeniensis]